MSTKEYRITWTLEEHGVIKAAADKAGMTLKAFITLAIGKEVERVSKKEVKS